MILDVQQLLKGFPATVKIHVGVILEFQLVHFLVLTFFGEGQVGNRTEGWPVASLE